MEDWTKYETNGIKLTEQADRTEKSNRVNRVKQKALNRQNRTKRIREKGDKHSELCYSKSVSAREKEKVGAIKEVVPWRY